MKACAEALDRVEEAELGARVRVLLRTITREPSGPAPQVDQLGHLGDQAPGRLVPSSSIAARQLEGWSEVMASRISG